MEENYKFALAPGSIIALSIIFFVIPSSVMLFSFSGVSFLNGEVWRIFTFPFTHTNVNHLLENMAALIMTSFLAYLIGMKGRDMLIIFFGSSLMLALTDTILFPTLVIAGASLGIFAILGSTSTKGTNYIPKGALMAVLASSVFFKYVIESAAAGKLVTGLVLDQTILHLFGFLSGILIFYILAGYKIKRRILTAD
jgi:membrane associated rhomboid family serine protease